MYFDKMCKTDITYMDGRRLYGRIAYMDALNSGSGLSKYSKKSKNFWKGTPVDKDGRYENYTEIFGFLFSRKLV